MTDKIPVKKVTVVMRLRRHYAPAIIKKHGDIYVVIDGERIVGSFDDLDDQARKVGALKEYEVIE